MTLVVFPVARVLFLSGLGPQPPPRCSGCSPLLLKAAGLERGQQQTGLKEPDDSAGKEAGGVQMLFVTWSQSPGSSHLSSGGSLAFSWTGQLGHQTDNGHGAKRARPPPAPLSNCTQASQNIAEAR